MSSYGGALFIHSRLWSAPAAGWCLLLFRSVQSEYNPPPLFEWYWCGSRMPKAQPSHNYTSTRKSILRCPSLHYWCRFAGERRRPQCLSHCCHSLCPRRTTATISMVCKSNKAPLRHVRRKQQNGTHLLGSALLSHNQVRKESKRSCCRRHSAVGELGQSYFMALRQQQQQQRNVTEQAAEEEGRKHARSSLYTGTIPATRYRPLGIRFVLTFYSHSHKSTSTRVAGVTWQGGCVNVTSSAQFLISRTLRGTRLHWTIPRRTMQINQRGQHSAVLLIFNINISTRCCWMTGWGAHYI